MDKPINTSVYLLGGATALVLYLTKKAKASSNIITNKQVSITPGQATNTSVISKIPSMLDQIDAMTGPKDIADINQIPISDISFEPVSNNSIQTTSIQNSYNAKPLPVVNNSPTVIINPPVEPKQTTQEVTITKPIQTTEPIYTNVTKPNTTQVDTSEALYYVIDPKQLLKNLPIYGKSTIYPFRKYNNILYTTYDLTQDNFITKYSATLESLKNINIELYNYYKKLDNLQKQKFLNAKQLYEASIDKTTTTKAFNNTISMLNLLINLHDYKQLIDKVKLAYINYNKFAIPNYTINEINDIKTPINPESYTGPIYIKVKNNLYTTYTMLGKSLKFFDGQIVSLIHTIDGSIVELDLNSIYREYLRYNVEEIFPVVAKYILSFLAKKTFANIINYSTAPTWNKIMLAGRNILVPSFEAINFLLKFDKTWQDLNPKLHSMAKKYNVSTKSYKDTTIKLQEAAKAINNDYTIRDYVAVKLLDFKKPSTPSDKDYIIKQHQIDIRLEQYYKTNAGNLTYVSPISKNKALGSPINDFINTITSINNTINFLM